MSTKSNTKVSVPVAVETRTKFNLPSDIVGSAEFMKLIPLMYRHCVKSEKISNSFVGNIRPAPLSLPTYGSVVGKIRHFFVPYRLLMPKYDSFYYSVIDSGPSSSSIPVGVPCFTQSDFNAVFTASDCSVAGTASDYDFEVAGNYYKFNSLGKSLYKIAYQLGYDLMPDSKIVRWNAFGLMAFARIFCDWYANDQYLNTSLYLSVMQLFNFNNPNNILQLSSQDIYNLLLLAHHVNYDTNGYFEAAWDHMNVPNTGQSIPVGVGDIDGLTPVVASNGNNLPYMKSGAGTSPDQYGSEYLHKMLNRLSEYQTRNGLSGARSIQRMLSTFGDTSKRAQLDRCVYLGFDDVKVDIGDVVATATSSNSSGSSDVGDYAGIGFGKGSGKIDYDVDEDGVYIVVQSIIPSGGYYQGYDRNNRHLEVFDFYHPETEVGMQAIERGEVYVSKLGAFSNNDITKYYAAFGHVGRYGEYKRPLNRVFGDIALKRIYNGGNSWHLMREFDDLFFSDDVTNIRHNPSFALGGDAFRFNRIFQYTDEDRDHFFCFYHFNLEVYSPMHSLFDTFDFENETKKVTLSSNGTTLN